MKEMKTVMVMKKDTEGMSAVCGTGWVPPEAAAAGGGRSETNTPNETDRRIRFRPPSSRTARLRLAPNPRESLTGIPSWILMEPHGE